MGPLAIFDRFQIMGFPKFIGQIAHGFYRLLRQISATLCDFQDDKTTWDWAMLTGKTWETHGKRVAGARQYLPRSFDRPPWNIAEKINRGYKAWEFLIYLYGLGPGLLHRLLPPPYWQHFCQLVSSIW
jgi:hypothetical protein